MLHNGVASGGNIVCPIHRWTYSASGRLLGAPHASIQTVGAAALRPAHAGSAVYGRWQRALQAVCGPEPGPHGAIWLTYYPEEIAAFEREFVEAQQAAYMETCVEDDEIAERMDAGRRALWLRGDDEVGSYQSPMEDGMRHFHEWYRARMTATSP
ncbi:ring-hydroxylating dioxygenase, large terminal subunit [Burkholderiales bacterium GJ-E10]|nr:ring-hydroxylating dioxygenase, large terminal subunit [Burkholderiales bacterium GJ-E10]